MPRKPRGNPIRLGRVLEAVRKGLQHAPEITQEANVPLLNVHPLLNLLRRQGRVEGYAGSLRFISATPLHPSARPPKAPGPVPTSGRGRPRGGPSAP